MSALLRVACTLGVMLWLGFFLVWRGMGSALPMESPTLRLERPLPIPEANRQEPKPPPMAETGETPTDAPPEPAVAVAPADVEHGEALLLGGGGFPALSFSYQSFPSFRMYAGAMERLGARFVVVRHSRIVGGVDLAGQQLTGEPEPTDLSPRARDYSAEPALARLTRTARGRFGADAEIMMLVPKRLDAGLFGGLARELQERGKGPERYRELRGRYERAPDGGIHLRVRSAERMDGGRESLDLLFDLNAIVRSPAA